MSNVQTDGRTVAQILLALRFTADTTMRIWCVNPNTMGDGTQTISPPGEPNCGNIASHKP
jgi:hypothetical protein